jgi:hypothetical protein
MFLLLLTNKNVFILHQATWNSLQENKSGPLKENGCATLQYIFMVYKTVLSVAKTVVFMQKK